MKKYLLYLVLYIFVLSCKENNDRLGSNQVSYDYELVDNGKFLSYALDNNTKYQFMALFPYTDNNGKEYLTFMNSIDEILFYDLKNEDFLFKIKTEKEGPNGIIGLSGYHVEDFENIYLTSVMTQGIIKIDTTGKIIQKINYGTTKTGYEVAPTFVSWSFFYTPPVFIDNKLYITQKPSPRSPVSKTPVSVVIDTLDNTFSELPFFFPIIKDDGLFTYSFFVLVKSRDFNGKEFVYSFYSDENIYVASIDHTEIKKIQVKSKYINQLIIERKSDDMIQTMKKDLEIPHYGNLIYDKYRNVYYRLAYPKVELEPDLDYRSMSSQGRKKFSIIILDEKFNIIGETLFPEYTYNPTVLFVHEDGLYICNNHQMNPSFNEDILSFQCFQVAKK
ncbi:hypothetical protein FACS189474_1110 [Bacteroidia bacterium]|nr:hypothetical protein FACS189474_1110 [Bacteroidia bacterium]